RGVGGGAGQPFDAVGRTQRGEQADAGIHLLRGGLRGGLRIEQRRELGAAGVQPLEQRGQRLHARRGGGKRFLRRAGERAVELAADERGAVGRVLCPLVRLLRDAAVHVEREEADQQILPFAGARVQEVGEVALRQHD